MSARHADDQELCRQQPGMCIGKLCDACEGRCPICDSRSNPTKPVKICDGCAGAERYIMLEQQQQQFGSFHNNNNSATQQQQQQKESSFLNPSSDVFGGSGGDSMLGGKTNPGQKQPSVRCIICNAMGKHTAYYCRACVLLEKDRDGCPRVKIAGTARKDAHHLQKQRKQYSAALNTV